MTVTGALAAVLTRDLHAVKRELSAYDDERDIWRLAPGVTNSSGTLAQHLAGNMQFFLGAVLGHNGYVRDRDAEFAKRDVPRAVLLSDLDAAIAAVRRGLQGLSDAELASPFPQAVAGITLTTGEVLLHLAAHLTYHLGQMDYHRRILTGNGRTVGALLPGELRAPRPE